jgi:hypothetical protein
MSGFRVFQRRNHRKIYRVGQTKIQAYVSLKIDAYFCLMSFMTLLDAVDANRLSRVCIAGQASKRLSINHEQISTSCEQPIIRKGKLFLVCLIREGLPIERGHWEAGAG